MTTKRKKLINLLKITFVQILPIMIGVYLGLVANNWNENQKAEELQNRLLESMKKELKANQKNIEHLLEYHQSLLDSTNAYSERYTIEELNELSAENFMTSVWRGTKVGTLKNATYQTAMVTGALADMDIDLAIQLSEIDLIQKDYSATGDKYLNSLIQMDSGESLQSTLIFIFSFTMDITSFEKALLKLYEQTLISIDEELNSN